MAHTDRPGNCVCDECFEEDCLDIMAAIPLWTRSRLEWIRHVRQMPLNWSIEPGHCALCGGTDMNVSKQADHWMVRNHNPVQNGNTLYTSILVANGGSWAATYKYVSKKGKEALKDWAMHVVGAAQTGVFPKPTVSGIAIREVEHWTEIRIGLTEARERAA